MITIILSMLATNLTAGQRNAIQNRGINWQVLNTRNGRILLDVIGQRDDLEWLIDQLTTAGKDPILIAAYRDGKRVKGVPVNVAAWLDVAPDVKDMTQPQAHAWVRPTQYDPNFHTYYGHTPKTDEEEP